MNENKVQKSAIDQIQAELKKMEREIKITRTEKARQEKLVALGIQG